MKRINKKGFTLIELLAVIIILGVLLLIAVPSVSKYIQNSRMKTYKTNLENLVGAVANEVNSMDYDSDYSFGSKEFLVVPFNKIELEKGSNTKSPFGEYDQNKSFVIVTRKYKEVIDDKGTDDTSDDERKYVHDRYEYYVQAVDSTGYGANFSLSSRIKITTIDYDSVTLLDLSQGHVYKADKSIGDRLSGILGPYHPFPVTAKLVE